MPRVSSRFYRTLSGWYWFDVSASGTSGRSTKLIHGGMRYLEKAFLQLDPDQLALVTEALEERAFFFRVAPHLTRPLPIILPIYHSWPSALFYAPYYWIGCRVCWGWSAVQVAAVDSLCFVAGGAFVWVTSRPIHNYLPSDFLSLSFRCHG